MVFTSAASMLFLPRELLLDFARSQLAGTLYVANVYFWSVAGYFDTSSYLKPLLHTWSLSVEEQFYAVWPLFLFLLKGRSPYWYIAAAGALSLVASEMVYSVSASTTFYMFPFRIFEFSIGALINAIPTRSKSANTHAALLVLAVLMLACSILLLDESSRLPGILNLPVCVATAVIIWLAHPWANLRTGIFYPLLRVGLISYSAYLVHWPLVVFYKILVVEELRWFDSALLVLATLVLAELSYRYVEQTFGRIKTGSRPRYWFAASLLVVVFAAVYLFAAPRVYSLMRSDDAGVQGILDNTPQRKGRIEQIRRDEGFPTRPEAAFKILVIGDSHAVDVALALSWALSERDIGIDLKKNYCEPLTLNSLGKGLNTLYTSHTNTNLTPTKCRPVHERFIPVIRKRAPNLVIFSDQWRAEALPYLEQTVVEIRQHTGASVLVLGPNFELRRDPRILLRDVQNPSDINNVAWARRKKDREKVAESLRRISEAIPVDYISKFDIVCPQGRCDILLQDQLSYSDGNHWTVKGMELFGQRLVNHPVFVELVTSGENRQPPVVGD